MSLPPKEIKCPQISNRLKLVQRMLFWGNYNILVTLVLTGFNIAYFTHA